MAEIESLQRRLENLQVGKLDEKLNEIITDGKPNGEYMTLVRKLSGKTKTKVKSNLKCIVFQKLLAALKLA